MSHNQSRAERIESSQYRKSGRSNHNRNFSGGTKGSTGTDGGATAPMGSAPSGQAVSSDSNTHSAPRAVQNCAHLQQPSHGATDAPATITTVRPAEVANPKATRAPRAPSSNLPAASSDPQHPLTPVTPAKDPAEASQSFPPQFGCLGPGLMNGMQARHDSLRAPPALPIPSVPRQLLPKKDAVTVDQSNAAEIQSTSKPKRDVQVSAPLPLTQTQKPSFHPIPGIPMQMPFHQPHVRVQFGGPNPQIQSQAMSAASLPMPMPMSGTEIAGGLDSAKDQRKKVDGQSTSFSLLSPQDPEIVGVKTTASSVTSMVLENLKETVSIASVAEPVANHGVLRNPRMQSPLQYPGSILPGQMQSLVPQVSIPDSKKGQRGNAFQKGLMHSPQTPLQIMHKAEKKYEVGKAEDEEEAKQGQLKAILNKLKAILNKLTPQNFDKLFEQVRQVNIDNAVTLTGLVSQIFDKALLEPTLCEMYANFCYHLAAELPDLSVDNEKITFKRLLLNKCQEEFERGEREQEEANKADVEGEAKQSAEEREEKRLQARRRMLGNIRLIGELYKKRMLTERIMHECIMKLLGQYQNSDEEDVEALCTLMSTIGEMIDHPKAKEHMDAYFDMMTKLSNNMKLSSRVRFMLKDAIHLRKNKWQLGTAFQKGLMPSPQTPLQVMHKAEKKYEVGKAEDEEEAKQGQLKAILNKLTPQNFDKLFEQVRQVNIDNAVTLTGLVSQIFDKALLEPTLCEMYANFCYHLAAELPDLSVDNEKITFKRLLLNKCQEEFERGEREQEEANKADVEGEAKQSAEEREEKRLQARRRMLGNIRLIGELYKKRMLTERIMHECIMKLLGQYQNSDEEDVEALCTLMSTIGEMIDHPKAKEHMDAYFDMMTKLSNNMKLSSRVRFMLKDAIHLRKNKWQLGTAFQKGLMPSPQTPLQVMHKAEKKYEVGKAEDEEEAKQGQLKAILNKLTPQNFDKLFEQVRQVNIDNAVTLTGVVSQIFDKALLEPTVCEMYANFCYHLTAELPDLSMNNEKITFKRLLLNKCQEEFERGEREQEEANKADVEGEAKQSAEEKKEKRLQARRRMLGNIRLIGELYKKRMLTERIMHECIMKLLGQYQNPDEEDVEALCTLMSTSGEMIDHPKAKEHMDAYFDMMTKLSNNMKLSSRVRFMLKDAIDLRKNKWQQRRKVTMELDVVFKMQKVKEDVRNLKKLVWGCFLILLFELIMVICMK